MLSCTRNWRAWRSHSAAREEQHISPSDPSMLFLETHAVGQRRPEACTRQLYPLLSIQTRNHRIRCLRLCAAQPIVEREHACRKLRDNDARTRRTK